MQCPSCQSQSLKLVKLQEGIAARQCQKCNGLLIDLLSYRTWSEGFKPTPFDQQPVSEVKDNSSALLCPKCSKVMLKFRFANAASNKIDTCSNCDEAWLDNDEWELLGSLALQGKLNAIFTAPWQKNIRERENEASHLIRFKNLLGEVEYNKLLETKEWINSHPHKSDLTRFILRT